MLRRIIMAASRRGKAILKLKLVGTPIFEDIGSFTKATLRVISNITQDISKHLNKGILRTDSLTNEDFSLGTKDSSLTILNTISNDISKGTVTGTLSVLSSAVLSISRTTILGTLNLISNAVEDYSSTNLIGSIKVLGYDIISTIVVAPLGEACDNSSPNFDLSLVSNDASVNFNLTC